MNSTQTIAAAPVRKNVLVQAAPTKAFELFTAHMTRWWIKTHSINKSPFVDIVVEPRPGEPLV